MAHTQQNAPLHMHTQISRTSLYPVFKGKRWVSRYTLFIQHLSHHFQHAHTQSQHTRNTHPYTCTHRYAVHRSVQCLKGKGGSRGQVLNDAMEKECHKE